MNSNITVAKERKRDAFIFIPGLGNRLDQTIDSIPGLLAAEFDRNALSPEAGFTVQSHGHEEEYVTSSGQVVQIPVRTIVRVEEKLEQPVADVFYLDYVPILTESFRRSNQFVQGLRLMMAVLVNLPKMGALLTGKEKKFSEKLQFLFAIFILFLLGAYMIVLLVAVVQTVMQILNQPEIQFAISWPKIITDTLGIPLNDILVRLTPTFSQAVVILTALVHVFAPNLQTALTSMATQYLGVIDYMSLSEQKDAISGVFADMLDYIAAKREYRHVNVIAFSFGSVVAIDNIFPAGWKPVPRTQIINNLVTIGCPFDLFRMMWKHYFEDRMLLPGVPGCWINVYSPLDILGSNFRNDEKMAEAKVSISADHKRQSQEMKAPFPENLVYTGGINPKGVSKTAWMSLLGLRAHNMYWKARPHAEISCFYEILGQLYKGDPVIS